MTPNCRPPGASLHGGRTQCQAPSTLQMPPPHPLLRVDTQAREASPGACSLEARPPTLSLPCGAVRVRRTIVARLRASSGWWPGTAAVGDHAPLHQALHLHPCPQATMLSSLDHTCPRRPHDLQNPDAPRGIRVRPNLLIRGHNGPTCPLSNLQRVYVVLCGPATCSSPRAPGTHTCQVCVTPGLPRPGDPQTLCLPWASCDRPLKSQLQLSDQRLLEPRSCTRRTAT